MTWRTPRTLAECHNILDLRELARRRLPTPMFHWLDGGAESETTAVRNVTAFDDIPLIPRCLVDVASVNTATRVLGADLAWPVFCAPTGASRFFHASGELAAARAAARAGTLYSLSMMSSFSLEVVAAASHGPKVFQLMIFRNRDVTRDLILRAKRAGFAALCLTVDTPVPGRRERDLRTGLGIPPKLTANLLGSFLAHPGWLLEQWRAGPLTLPNVAEHAGRPGLAAQSRFFGEQLDPSVTWKDVREMIDLWGGPFVLKGVMAVDDARRAVELGATAIIVSNHGGRQLDGAAAPIEVLPEIVRAVGDQIEVILDGGVRRGVHVLKALALGAKACSIGRPYLFGLSAGGEAGVVKALEMLRAELVRAMQLCGVTDVRSVDPDIISSARRAGTGHA